ncbi:hypothetical protein MY11210_007513 [Beauveria gryllotalpidicola]
MQAADEPLILTVDHDSEGENGDDGNDDCGSSPDESPSPDPLQWKPGLECILYEDDSIADVLPGLDVYTICHLLEIFTSLASAPLRTLLPTVEIHSHLSSGTMPRCLILAACASAVRFSVHKAVNGPFARQFADSIAREARNCIRISNDVPTQVNTIKSICILVDYSASKAHGRQAWADIAMGQALIQLARLDCETDAEGGDALKAAERYLAAAQLTHCLGHPRLYPEFRRPDGKSRPEAQCTTLKRGPPDLVNLLEILYATLVGFACTQGALVSINRLDWSSKPYEPTSVGNLRMTLAVLEALKTFYTPAEDWMDILVQAHDSNMRSTLTSGDLDLAFCGYFGRFIDIREPTFVPLDPREKDTSQGAIGTPESVQSQERCQERNSKNSDLPNTTTSDRDSEWLKAYAGHLSGDIESDSDSDHVDADNHTKAAHSGPTLASATCEENTILSRNAEQVLEAVIPESETVGSSEHMGAAILTAMSGNMCSPATRPRQSQPEQLQLEHVGDVVQMDMDDGFAAAFDHMPSFSEVMGLNMDMSMFPGLDLVVGGPDMLPDVFNHNDAQENVARIALAIDYDANGYRSLLPMAMQEPALLNAAIAVAASHYSRWQHTPDTVSRRYHRAASKALRDRFIAGNNIHRQDILATMLLLVSFEVFSGSSRWKEHYNAIRGWIRSRGDCSDLDPFLKTWVCLLDTQSSLNLGQPAMPELMSWLDVPVNSEEQGDCVDALFGCSSKLVKLMWAASRLCTSSGHGQVTKEELGVRADSLQEQIRATAILPDSNPSLNISCHQLGEPLTAIGMEQEELRRRIVATAEIFRHASHIYVYRIVHSPEVALTEDLQRSLNTAQDLLTMVPDALGPGANLGWCLVVLGAEMDQAHERDYVESKLDGLHLLGLDNTKNGQKILEEVWAHRDLVRQGQASPESWQDAMQRIGQSQILV